MSADPNRWRRVGIFSPGLLRLAGLRRFLGAERVLFRPRGRDVAELDAVAGWGHKPTAEPARQFARRHGVPYLALEDGFIRSIGLRDAPLSIVVDDLGIYYDAGSPSRLERWLEEGSALTPELVRIAARCRERIVTTRLSKYNHGGVELPARWRSLGEGRPFVLVVDQTFEDAAVTLGRGGPQTFRRMLEAARDEHPDARIVIKTHPAVVAGHKRGYLTSGLGRDVEILGEAVNPIALLERAAAVYVVSSQLGFEALLCERPVRCFGAPFYAGWGLTEDAQALPRRTSRRSLDELVAASLLLYPRYQHPVREALCDLDAAMDHLLLQRDMLADNAHTFHCVGFTTWKRPFVRRYLARGSDDDPQTHRAVRFHRSLRKLRRQAFDHEAVVLQWGTRHRVQATSVTGEPVPVWRMEDGFLRSVKLGSQLTPPGSLVVDRRGIYYDPTRPSDLEHLLAEAEFGPEELARARRLREQILDTRISKYNLAAAEQLVPRAREGQRVALVVGQVDDDASVRLGSPRVRNNVALLRAARRLRPEAHLVYKPHPDVLSGNRKGAKIPGEGIWDELVTDVSIAACLEAVDEVHTMTSLVGFEALLRELPVVCHGQPFYAGWGLTEDQMPHERRQRKRSLDELVAATLLRYPRYYSWRAKAFCTAEDMVAELDRARREQPARLGMGAPWVLRRLRDVAILSWEWLHA